jgi:hypothetical protein
MKITIILTITQCLFVIVLLCSCKLRTSGNGGLIFNAISIDLGTWGDEEAKLISQLGAGMVRIPLCNWPQDKHILDDDVNSALKYGLTVYAEINYCTTDVPTDGPPFIERQKFWHANFTDSGNKFAWDFVSATKDIAQFFKGRIKYYEIWNEPGAAPRPFGYPNPKFPSPDNADWNGACGAYTYGTDYSQGVWALCPRQLAVITTNSFMAIKEIDPNASVVMGNLLLHGENGWVGKEYLKQVINAPAVDWFKKNKGGGYPWDVIGIHPYNFIPEDPTQNSLREVLKWFKQTMVDSGMSLQNYSLAISEYGFDTNDVSEDIQAKYLTESYQVSKQEGLEFLIWFNYLDAPQYGLRYGIRHETGDWKLAASSYCNVTRTPLCPVK